MTVLNTLNFVAFKPQTQTNPVAMRRRKLIAKIEEQIQLAKDPSHSPKKHKWITDSDGNQRKLEVPKRLKRWWMQSSDGKINLVIRYGSKPLEFAKGKNAIELNSEAEVLEVLAQMKEAADSGELDAILEKQAQFGRLLQTKRA
jgi:hypothetical protein